MSKRVVTIPLPRVVEGTPRRCRGRERVAVLDDVPLLLDETTAAHAPVVLRERVPAPHEGRVSGDYRLVGDAFYRPLDHGDRLEGIRPEELGPVMVGRLRARLGIPYADFHHRSELADWEALFEGVNRKRGLAPSADVAFASVDDDGLAGQRALAEHARASLLLVDGRLHVRVPAPGYHVLAITDGVAVTTSAPLAVAFGGRRHEREWWCSFRPDRRDDALAFARAMAGALPDPGKALASLRDVPSFEVVDAAALASAFPVDDLDAAARAARETHARASRGCAGYLSDEGVGLFLEGRRVAATGEAPSARESTLAMDALASSVVDALAALRREGFVPRETLDAFDASRKAYLRCRLRMEVVEEPRHALDETDEAALGGLVRGM